MCVYIAYVYRHTHRDTTSCCNITRYSYSGWSQLFIAKLLLHFVSHLVNVIYLYLPFVTLICGCHVPGTVVDGAGVQ